MDEIAIWEKVARQQENRMRRSQVLFEVVSAIFPKIALLSMRILINHYDLPSLSPSGHYRKI